MFAILISEETLPKIVDSVSDLSLNTVTWLDTCVGKKRYFVRGYVDRRGALHPWVFLPEYYLVKFYDVDLIKAQTEWDQIFRF